MAISLKDHEDRIVTLESKIGAGGGIIESSLTNPGYVKFANGLIINFAYAITTSPLKFKKPFTQILGVAHSRLATWEGKTDGTYCGYNSISNTQLTFTKYSGFNDFSIIAIGYLISNRILNYISKFLNSVKNLKVVI